MRMPPPYAQICVDLQLVEQFGKDSRCGGGGISLGMGFEVLKSYAISS